MNTITTDNEHYYYGTQELLKWNTSIIIVEHEHYYQEIIHLFKSRFKY